jgi:hypothetical protein
MARNRSALLVGIDHYTCFPDVGSCRDDAAALAQRLHDDAESWNWGASDGERGTLLASETVSNQQFRQHLQQALEASRGGDFLFYFAGRGFVRNGDLALAHSSYEPNYTQDDNVVLVQRDILDPAKEKRINRAIVILDCSGSEKVEDLHVPRGAVILANPWLPQNRDRSFSRILLTGLGGNGAKGTGFGWDAAGRVSALSLLSYVINSVTNLPDQTPLLKGTLDSNTQIRTVSMSSDTYQKIGLTVFRQDGSDVVADLVPDMEYPTGIDTHQLGWDESASPLKETVAELARKGKTFSFRSRPPGYQVEPGFNGSPCEQQQMEFLKALKKAGMLEIIDPPDTDDLFWACLRWGRARLTETGKEWYRSISMPSQLF